MTTTMTITMMLMRIMMMMTPAARLSVSLVYCPPRVPVHIAACCVHAKHSLVVRRHLGAVSGGNKSYSRDTWPGIQSPPSHRH